MIRSLIKLALVLVVTILVYNYFMGTPEEKTQSQEIFNDIKSVVGKSIDLLKQEKNKYEAGKYDGAIDKVGNAIEAIRDKAEAIQDSETLERLRLLDQRRRELEESLAREEPTSYDRTNKSAEPARPSAEVERNFDELIRELEALEERLRQKGKASDGQ